MNLTDQSLVVHLFVAATGPRRSGSYRRLREVWAACGPALGMTQPVAAIAVPGTLPEDPGELPQSGAVAAIRSQDGLCQAFLRRHHDLLCLSVALSPAPGEAGSWAAWEQRWTQVGGTAGEWAVGEARLFVAYANSADPSAVGSRDTEESLRSALPADAAPSRLGPRVEVADPPVVLWEMAGESGDRSSRRFAAVAADHENVPDEVERWLWSQGGGTPPPFARYLAAAAGVRYEMRVHAAQQADSGTGAVVDSALAALEEPPASPDGHSEELVRWRTRLLALIAGSAGLTQRITRLREMSNTVRIGEANMRAHRDAAGVTEGAPGPFAEDLALAGRFTQRLSDDLVYLEADRERARDTLSALTTEAENALQRRREHTQQQEALLNRRQSTVNLLQGAFLGAVLMVLAAVQALSYKVSFLPRPAVPALISLLGALALLLATLVLWLAAPPQERGAGGLGPVFAGLAGATAGWLTVTTITHAITGHGSSTLLTWAVALPCFGAGWLFTRLRLRAADQG
ncbi:CATRA conflict system CASPASE/TPR repeat-associated protein [Streptomyces albipurpureus]|uniref:BN6_48550 family protein n=1 Tax=Streptomyces albipurpureus TaxID=2897419 RepID=A0ABT0UH71_9ACTN|nr:CATRA conflict system CASPASE/TPR repeat-associated protein [Streptomyces sp. CWNU-1]MCM2387676.1 BN6_48550 family protein [Streptomyces sp. CWNU-1]